MYYRVSLLLKKERVIFLNPANRISLKLVFTYNTTSGMKITRIQALFIFERLIV